MAKMRGNYLVNPVSAFIVGLAMGLASCQPIETGIQDENLETNTATPVAIETGLAPSTNQPLSVTPSLTPTPASTPEPQPSPSPVSVTKSLGGRLVFSSIREDTNGDGLIDIMDAQQLHILDLSTRASTQLTSGPASNDHPAWSPDGEWIAFVSNQTGNYELFIIHPDGSGLKQMTNTAEAERHPRWSPDGKYIAYTLAASGQRRNIHLIEVETGQTQLLVESPGEDRWPDWSPDGRFLTFERQGPEAGVYLLNIETNSLTQLTPNSLYVDTFVFGSPRWLKNDRLISINVVAGDCQGSLCQNVYRLLEVDSSPTLGDLSKPLLDIGQGWGNPVWGPNGEWIIDATLFEVSPTAKSAELYQAVELMLLPIDPTIYTSPGQYYHLDLTDGERLTANNFYDAEPDWTP